ncbi:3-hydroxyacyl-CoA dehydrogenase family protein [Ralstonia pseudosolanacearum]|uniref:3-hydroxyacyl-CoA dehydrogenase family protein n=1 Tax=Ralstonia pseudosolanacearum TaxID=1310165 RepID=UPI0005C54DD4|nr:3-hydroxyacyl-CoA dehydrogenase NAD-binding domain-containing protein [Ralstonia pseudosolanacearum]MCK4147580.1 3-hydroxyacyl-CoA dehydrogenase [Ralstonia pseudosolanacearum]
MQMNGVAIVGCGIMGRDIAALFVSAGWATQVVERTESRWDEAEASIAASANQIGTFDGRCLEFRRGVGEINWSGVSLVLEVVSENLNLKRAIIAELDALAPPDVVIGSNSSSMRITDISAGCPGARRMANTHFFQPAHLVPLVEIAKGEATTDETVDRLYEIFSELGGAPVRVNRDLPGFLANRMQHALMREAFFAIDSGLASAEDVDIAVKFGFGFRYAAAGPMLLKEFAGFDTQHAAATVIYPSLCNGTAPGKTLSSLVAQGRFGMKAKKGLRDWTSESIDRERTRYEAALLQAVGILGSPRGGNEQ